MKKRRRTLLQKIRSYRRTKWLAASPLIVVGLVGVALPILPGLPFLAAGMALVTPLKPQQQNNFKKK